MMKSYDIKTHLVAYGKGIDKYLPKHLRNNTDLQSRALVVEDLDMVDDVEFIVRGYLTGSGLDAYNKTGQVCGHKLPSGLQDGDKLPCLLDTPSTKAQVGHDEHRSATEVRAMWPEQTYLAFKIYQIANGYASSKGVVLADTKFELGKNVCLADEALTPDSSRFWDLSEWLESRKKPIGRKAPSSCDKQLVREWGKTKGFNDIDPKNPRDVARVHRMKVPQSIINQTTDTYCRIFCRLTGMALEQFQRKVMHIVPS